MNDWLGLRISHLLHTHVMTRCCLGSPHTRIYLSVCLPIIYLLIIYVSITYHLSTYLSLHLPLSPPSSLSFFLSLPLPLSLLHSLPLFAREERNPGGSAIWSLNILHIRLFHNTTKKQSNTEPRPNFHCFF